VKERITRNLKHSNEGVSKDHFWRTLVSCLLTTQQRSGLGSRVDEFLKTDDPILDFDYCSTVKNLPKVVEETLSNNGLRRNERIAKEVNHAASWLKQDGWLVVKSQLDLISSHTSAKKERSVARFLQDKFKGIGPKQSRNLIQWMGLSKYEIPLDSRMVKVLKKLQFPVPLSAIALADESYYCFIEDGIQKLMSEIRVYPCVFDACAFASLEADRP
jgi:thermostable 8-oxoguanine DNA glycosylase